MINNSFELEKLVLRLETWNLKNSLASSTFILLAPFICSSGQKQTLYNLLSEGGDFSRSPSELKWKRVIYNGEL